MNKEEIQVQIEVLQRDIENLTRTLEEANEEIQNIREQVCEEIRNKICRNYSYVTSDYNLGEININTQDFIRILEIISKGEFK